MSKIFFSLIARPIKAILHMESQGVGEMKVFAGSESHDQDGYLTSINSSKFFRSKMPDGLETLPCISDPIKLGSHHALDTCSV